MSNVTMSSSELEQKLLAVFEAGDDKELDAIVSRVSNEFIKETSFSTPNVSEVEIAQRFTQSAIREEPQDTMEYLNDLIKNVVEDGIHTSSPLLIGHMTSALPNYMKSLAKLVVSMNQNVVKTETAKTITFLEREAMAKLHRLIFNRDEEFYAKHIQDPAYMLGLFASGGTLANTSALWIARNSALKPSSDGSFKGVEREGVIRAMRYYGYSDIALIGSTLMHYSLDKAADLLGVGVHGLVKIPANANYQVDLAMMEAKIIELLAAKTLICAIVGICGTTETGAIDDLDGMARLASKYNIHFHCDAAWGGPCIFSKLHRSKAKGIELADSVTLDGHKQLWLPMGCGMVFLKSPTAVDAVSKTANYIIRKDSYDLGKFTIDGSRGAQAIYLHANLELLGLRGYEVLFDRTVRMARYMARCIMRSENFELLVKPMSNILLYRWIPATLRQKVWEGTLTDEDNEYIDECNRQLQNHQKNAGKTFVSRTTISCPKYNHKGIVGLRVVIGNPLTKEEDIDAVFWDQNAILMPLFSTKDVTSNPAAVILRDVPEIRVAEAAEGGNNNYFEALWASMSLQHRLVFNDDVDTFLDALITPDCSLHHDVKLRKSLPWLGGASPGAKGSSLSLQSLASTCSLKREGQSDSESSASSDERLLAAN